MRSGTSKSTRLPENAHTCGRPRIASLLLSIDGTDGWQDNHSQGGPGAACVSRHVMLAHRGEHSGRVSSCGLTRKGDASGYGGMGTSATPGRPRALGIDTAPVWDGESSCESHNAYGSFLMGI